MVELDTYSLSLSPFSLSLPLSLPFSLSFPSLSPFSLSSFFSLPPLSLSLSHFSLSRFPFSLSLSLSLSLSDCVCVCVCVCVSLSLSLSRCLSSIKGKKTVPEVQLRGSSFKIQKYQG